MKKISLLIYFIVIIPLFIHGRDNIRPFEEWLESTGTYSRKYAKKKLTRLEADELAEKMYKHQLRKDKEEFLKPWQDKVITWNDYVMKFEYHVYGEKPKDGRSLYISMHGGGNTAPEVNTQQWKNQQRLYQPGEGVYLAPRAAVDDWNMWFQPHVDSIFDKIIRAAAALMDVNPNKVYLTGYSAGGDGAYRLAPRMADRWAAAAMMAGHPGDVSPVNLRNIGFTLWMGENDRAYNRNAEAVRFGAELDSLQRADPEGYIHQNHIVEGKGHWMDRADTAAIPWLAQFRRNPLPQKIVWRQDDTPCGSFYWLSVPLEQAGKGNTVVVERRGNTITIEQNDYKTLHIGLNDLMIDFSRPVKVVAGGKVVFNKKVHRSAEDIYHSVIKRKDPGLIFSAYITVSDN